jgi:hypothetical protein
MVHVYLTSTLRNGQSANTQESPRTMAKALQPESKCARKAMRCNPKTPVLNIFLLVAQVNFGALCERIVSSGASAFLIYEISLGRQEKRRLT